MICLPIPVGPGTTGCAGETGRGDALVEGTSVVVVVGRVSGDARSLRGDEQHVNHFSIVTVRPGGWTWQ